MAFWQLLKIKFEGLKPGVAPYSVGKKRAKFYFYRVLHLGGFSIDSRFVAKTHAIKIQSAWNVLDHQKKPDILAFAKNAVCNMFAFRIFAF